MQTPDQQLYQAVLCGDAAAAMRLLDAGADVHTLNAEGNTLLHAAVLRERPGLVRLLLDRGADPDRLNARALSPIYTTLAKDRRLLRLDEFSLADSNLGVLLDAGADPNAGQSFAHTLFHIFERKPYRTKNSYTEMLTALLAAGLDPDMQDATGQTFLHHVCLMKKPPPDPIIQLLLEKGADASVTDRMGCNPLHVYVATTACKDRICEALVAAGAAPGAQDANGRTALHRTVSTYVTKGRGKWYRFQKIIRSLLKSGCAPDTKDRFGDTPLDMVRETETGYGASGSDHPYYDILRHALHPRPPQPRKRDMPNKSTEMYNMMMYDARSKSKQKRPELLKTKLEKWGGHIINQKGNSLLHRIADQQAVADESLIPAIIAAGGDVNFKNRTGLTPLMVAVEHSGPEMVAALIKAGADVNASNLDGQTALHLAADKFRATHGRVTIDHSLNIIKILLDAGADVQAADEEGFTPLHFAMHDASVCAALLEGGANPDMQDDYGYTPLHVDRRGSGYMGELNNSYLTLLAAGAAQDRMNINGDLPVMSNLGLIRSDADYYGHYAIGTGNHIIDHLLKSADINTTNYHGHSALMKAVSLKFKCSTRQVRVFLAMGADANAGKCAVHELYKPYTPHDNTYRDYLITSPDRREILQRLLDAGLDPASPDPDSGNTLLHSLCRDGAPTPDTDLLLDHGADANARNARGETPLLQACLRDGAMALSASLIRTLVEHQADPNLCDQAGHTAMHYLEQSCGGPAGVPDNIRDIMLDYGAEPATVPAQAVTGRGHEAAVPVSTC